MIKRYAVLLAFVLMFSFSNASAQTLEQYKKTPAPQPSMSQLATTPSLRTNLSLDDLKVVYSYCLNTLAANQKTVDAEHGRLGDSAQSQVDFWSKACPVILAEINSRPVPASAPAPTMEFPVKSKSTTSIQASSDSFPGPVTGLTPSTTDEIEYEHIITLDNIKIESLIFQRDILLVTFILELIAGLALVKIRYRK